MRVFRSTSLFRFTTDYSASGVDVQAELSKNIYSPQQRQGSSATASHLPLTQKTYMDCHLQARKSTSKATPHVLRKTSCVSYQLQPARFERTSSPSSSVVLTTTEVKTSSTGDGLAQSCPSLSFRSPSFQKHMDQLGKLTALLYKLSFWKY